MSSVHVLCCISYDNRVLADYESPTLDLRNPKVYRDFTKPMGAINPKRLESFKTRYRLLFILNTIVSLYGVD
jgi:hypothetical protein